MNDNLIIRAAYEGKKTEMGDRKQCGKKKEDRSSRRGDARHRNRNGAPYRSTSSSKRAALGIHAVKQLLSAECAGWLLLVGGAGGWGS